MKLIKKGTALLMLLLLLLTSMSTVWADDYAIFGGIMREQTLKSGVYSYQEVTFVSGKPIVLTGTVTVPTIPDRDSYTISIRYSLANPQEQATLERTVSYAVAKVKNASMGQVILDQTIPVGGLKETIVIGGDTYNLTSFHFSRSAVTDVHPGINFDAGYINYRKVFHINGDETNATHKLTVDGESKQDLGFNTHWSSSSTKIVHQTVRYEAVDDTQTESNWDGTAVLKFSTKEVSTLSYLFNDVIHISFRGGLLKSTNRSVIMQYSYDFPDTEDAQGVKRALGDQTLNAYVFNTSTRLPVPNYLDLGDHWATEESFRMGSLEAFDTATFFFPDTYITREQFAKALVNTITYLKPETQEEIRQEVIRQTRPNAPSIPFTDIRRESPYYIFIERVFKDGLMQGEGTGQFLPTRPLHREEAITVMVRALGIQNIAPILPFNTGFGDDARIAHWAKPSVYMAKEIGLIKGNPDGNLYPKDLMTRAQAAVMLSRFIDHLTRDITEDYREKLLHQY